MNLPTAAWFEAMREAGFEELPPGCLVDLVCEICGARLPRHRGKVWNGRFLGTCSENCSARRRVKRRGAAKEVLERFLADQLPEVGITVREAAKVVGIVGEPTHNQLQHVNGLLADLGWRRAGEDPSLRAPPKEKA